VLEASLKRRPRSVAGGHPASWSRAVKPVCRRNRAGCHIAVPIRTGSHGRVWARPFAAVLNIVAWPFTCAIVAPLACVDGLGDTLHTEVFWRWHRRFCHGVWSRGAMGRSRGWDVAVLMRRRPVPDSSVSQHLDAVVPKERRVVADQHAAGGYFFFFFFFFFFDVIFAACRSATTEPEAYQNKGKTRCCKS